MPRPLPERVGAARDTWAVLWLGALPMALSAALPWAVLRPNRLAPGEAQGLSALLAVLVLALTALPLLLAWRAPRWAGLGAALALVAGVVLLGQRTALALGGQAEFARASAGTGLWLYLLGAGIAVYGASRLGPRLLAALWLPGVAAVALLGGLGSWSVLAEGRAEGPRWAQEAAQHLRLVGTALGVATLIGAPLAVWSARRPVRASAVLGAASAVQTVPSLALLGLLIAPLSALAGALPGLRALGVSGIGAAPALCAMTLYALLPVVRAGVLGLRGVPPGAVDAARGMGMTPGQRFWRVELPLALPVWLSGVRQAAVLLVGVAAVAALIGAGGLGTYIFKGLQGAAADLILLGALPAAALALGLDAALRALEGLLARRLGSVAP